jgi:hypothetical protein
MLWSADFSSVVSRPLSLSGNASNAAAAELFSFKALKTW